MPTSTLTKLRRKAAAQVRQYPQYKGHFKNYGACQVTREIKTKFGIAFKKGDVTLCSRQPASSFSLIPRSVMAWSFRNKINTSVPEYDVKRRGH